MADIKIYNPDGLAKPLGPYCHVTRVKAAEFLFIAGQLSVDTSGAIVGDGDFAAHCAQVYANIETALKSAGANWSNVVQFTTYLVNSGDVPKLAEYRLREFSKMFPGGGYPPNTLLIVNKLASDKFLIEVQTHAAL